ncbi:hypothetical protein DI487_08330 [Flavobacterium sediminis]|uniref:Uncharacterized protein n=1 Tax=Flavobacterium sediminis TaxID=2201181 RepID=A0A2U8QVP6_9FLAO|nr:hypothetical protein DI487_08330 [Flavobacterium sediminis]
MEKLISFLVNNKMSLLIALLFYTLYAYYTYAGNRICDCESTENYKQTNYNNHRTINSFYHK